MYRIKFYDFNGCFVALHTIIADNCKCEVNDMIRYCSAITKCYSNVKYWYIYEYSGTLLAKNV